VVNVFQANGDSPLSRLFIVNITGAVRGQIGLSVLILGDLELPSIQADGILHEKKDLVRK